MVEVSDLFGVRGAKLLREVQLPAACRYRVDSLLQLIAAFDREIAQTAQLTSDRLRDDPGYAAVRTIPGSGRSWEQCSWPRSATCTDSPGPSS